MEKLASMGFPARQDLAEALGLPLLRYEDWPGLHTRAGNTQHMPQAVIWQTLRFMILIVAAAPVNRLHSESHLSSTDSGPNFMRNAG